MKKSLFNFNLPEELIAQNPIENRDDSKMLVLSKQTGDFQHKKFKSIVDIFEKGDLIILNNSKVIKARVYGTRKETGSRVEFLFLREIEKNIWETLTKPGKKSRQDHQFIFDKNLMEGKIIKVLDNGNRVIQLSINDNKSIYDILEKIGETPLPLYINNKISDDNRYQTVFSKEKGSVAAPTDGLHFTKDILKKLTEKGVNIGYITLHVGVGTFRPVKCDDIRDHNMHTEYYSISKETANLINVTKQQGKNIIAVGTTSCRTLESAYNNGKIQETNSKTNIFIYPGYKFKIVDALLTNFHLPESSLIMLVSALAGRDKILSAYQSAIENRYRFYSFGDCMLIK